MAFPAKSSKKSRFFLSYASPEKSYMPHFFVCVPADLLNRAPVRPLI